jgi:hypothetical protein
MNVHQWADWAVIAQAFLAFAAALVAYWQITAAKGESKKWKTLEACALYETEPIASSVVRLRHLYSQCLYNAQELSSQSPGLFCLVDDARLVLNYLDGIAIGVRQGLYIENLARDHLATIVRAHITELFDKKRAGVDTTDYIRLVDWTISGSAIDLTTMQERVSLLW